MAWIFLPGGLLMPAEFPADKADPKFVPEGSDFDLQIRARVKSHLENFIRDYMEPMGLTYSEIEATPQMDYNFRFYCSREDFAKAIAEAMLNIDYMKFKPTAEDRDEEGKPLYADGKDYHSVLNTIWGSVTRLGRPGGVWAYEPGKKGAWAGYTSKYSGRTYAESVAAQDRAGRWWRDEPVGNRPAGTSRWDDEYDAMRVYEGGTAPAWNIDTDDVKDSDSLWKDLHDAAGLDFPDYVSPSEARRNQILFEVDDIPPSQWGDYLSDEELDIVREEHRQALDDEFRDLKASKRKAKRIRRERRGRRAHRGGIRIR
jgi:hypothetical protein